VRKCGAIDEIDPASRNGGGDARRFIVVASIFRLGAAWRDQPPAERLGARVARYRQRGNFRLRLAENGKAASLSLFDVTLTAARNLYMPRRRRRSGSKLLGQSSK